MANAAIGWQEAVARLAGERTRAEFSAAVLKALGSPVQVHEGARLYAEAKAEVDGVIAGLIVAVAAGKTPKSLPDLEARLERGIAAGEALGRQAEAVLAAAPGRRNLKTVAFTDLTGLGKVIEALKALVERWADADLLTRKTIQTQLEAARWPDFTDVKPLA